MERALPLELVPFDSSALESGNVANMTAEEYLSWVRHQAESLPDVSRIEVDYSHLQKRQTRHIHDSVLNMPSCPTEFLPNEKWELDMLHNFSELRMFIYRQSMKTDGALRKISVPALKDSQGWMLFCLGQDVIDSVSDTPTTNIINNKLLSINDTSSKMTMSDDNTENILQKRKLEVSQIAGIDITDMFACAPKNKEHDKDNQSIDNDDEIDNNHSNNNDDNAIDDTEVIHTSSSSSSTSSAWTGSKKISPKLELLLQFDQVMTQRLLSHQINWLIDSKNLLASPFQGVWLYALLARLEKPLCRDMAAQLRQLFRVCSQCRVDLHTSSTQHNNSSMSVSLSSSLNSARDSSSSNIINSRITKNKRSPHSNTSIAAIITTAAETIAAGLAKESLDEKLATLNTLICITGSYFGQGEEYDSRQHVAETTMTTAEDDDGDDNSNDDDNEESEDDYDDGEDEKEYVQNDRDSGNNGKKNKTSSNNGYVEESREEGEENEDDVGDGNATLMGNQ